MSSAWERDDRGISIVLLWEQSIGSAAHAVSVDLFSAKCNCVCFHCAQRPGAERHITHTLPPLAWEYEQMKQMRLRACFIIKMLSHLYSLSTSTHYSCILCRFCCVQVHQLFMHLFHKTSMFLTYHTYHIAPRWPRSNHMSQRSGSIVILKKVT